MGRRRQESEPQEPRLTVPRAIFDRELEERMAIGQGLLQAAQEVNSVPRLEEVQADYYVWNDYNTTLLKQRFTTSAPADDYAYWGVMSVGPRSAQEKQQELIADIEKKLRRLRSVRERLPLYEEPESPREAARQTQQQSERMTIFVVHGRDEASKLAVHGFLREVTPLKAVILHDQANAGRTIIEKFEDHAADAAVAVIIMTADDVGGLEGSTPQPRARQNVVFEFGFFVGAIGRNRVAILYEPGVERPSDIDGVTYIPLDDAGAWKLPLARELKAARIPVDAEKLL